MKVTVFTEMREANAPETSAARLIELAHHLKLIVICGLLQNPNTPAEALAIIADKHPSEYIWRQIVTHPGTTPELLSRLSTSSYPRVLELVGEHPKTPAKILIALSLREASQAVARNPATPTDVLERLSLSSDNRVLSALAQNPNTPPSVALRCGAKFPHALLKNPALDLMLLEGPEMFSSLPSEQIRSFLYTTAPPDWIWKAAVQHKEARVRALAAKHKNIPEQELEELRKDTDPKVQRAIQRREPPKP